MRAAEDGEEVKESTLEFMKRWMGWRKSFWFHNLKRVAPKMALGGLLWPEKGGHLIYQDSEQERKFRRRLVDKAVLIQSLDGKDQCRSKS